MSEKTEIKQIYLHKVITDHNINGERENIEEFLRDGPKGISFQSLKLEQGKKKSYLKVSGKEMEDGTFAVNVKTDGGNTEQQMLSKKDFMAFLKKHKQLAFLEKYMSKEMDKFRKTLKSEKKPARATRKSSKKSSKKKVSKKTSKKTKKTSKKPVKKSSKKTTKKTSKKKGSKKN